MLFVVVVGCSVRFVNIERGKIQPSSGTIYLWRGLID